VTPWFNGQRTTIAATENGPSDTLTEDPGYRRQTMEKKSKADILRIIKQRVAAGVLLPGCSISERDIANECRVSRTPVREALIQLEALGFLNIVPRSGIFVARLSVRQLLAMLETLAHLEGLCLSLVAQRIDANSLELVQTTHAECGRAMEAGDVRRYEACNHAFHELLYRSCRNEFLVDQIDLIRSRTAVYRLKRFEMVEGLHRSWVGHGRMIAAVMAADPQTAAEAAAEHIAMGGREFTEVLNRLPEELFSSVSHAPTHRPPPSPFWQLDQTAAAWAAFDGLSAGTPIDAPQSSASIDRTIS
jgi:DNA-binding GntR family transcriptional regulator